MGNQWPDEMIEEGNLFEGIITRFCMIPRDFTMRKSNYFQVGGYDTQLKTHEDWDLKIRLAKRYPFHYTGINGVAYRQHPHSLSKRSYPLLIKNLWKVFNKNIEYVEDLKKEALRREFEKFMIKRENS